MSCLPITIRNKSRVTDLVDIGVVLLEVVPTVPQFEVLGHREAGCPRVGLGDDKYFHQNKIYKLIMLKINNERSGCEFIPSEDELKSKVCVRLPACWPGRC